MLYLEKCPRGCEDCTPLSNLVTEDEKDFVCCGRSNKGSREIEQDKFRHCFKNDATDSMYDYDEYDIKSVISILSNALLVDYLEDKP